MLIVTTLCGCFNNNSSKNSAIDQKSIYQIRNNTINAVDNISSYKGNIKNDLNSSIFKGAEKTVSVMMSNTNLSVNISNHTVEHKTETITFDEDEKDITLVYIIDNLKYTGFGKEGNLTWEIAELSSASDKSIWTPYSPLDHFAGLIAYEVPGQNITWKRLKDESFNDKEYYVLKSEHILNDTNPMLTGFNNNEIYHTFWIDKTNYFFYKIKLNQILDITGDYAGEDDKIQIISEFIFTFYDYNVPVKIELPPEAIP